MYLSIRKGEWNNMECIKLEGGQKKIDLATMDNTTRKNEIQDTTECNKSRYECVATCYMSSLEPTTIVALIKTNDIVEVVDNSDGYVEIIQKKSAIDGAVHKYQYVYDMPHEQFKVCFKKIKSEEE